MNNEITIPQEVIQSKIYFIRNQKVMLDSDLAELYGVETKQLKRQVKRNSSRFPDDFMFILTKEENESLRSQFGTLNRGEHSKYLPMAFTEQGVSMLSSVLSSDRAIAVNIQIIRLFTKMRELILTNQDILKKLGELESTDKKRGQQIDVIFKYIQQLENGKAQQKEQQERIKIGFKSDEKK
jgi:hypothetical protein